MPTNGMTINGLNTVTSITAQDKVPVWDNEATGEPTRKITGQNLANSVKTLASLVDTDDLSTAIQPVTNAVQKGSISGGTTSTLTFDKTGAHILALSRRNQSGLGVVLLMDNASSSYTVIGGAVPSTITITKDTSSGDVTVQNSATFAVYYLLI